MDIVTFNLRCEWRGADGANAFIHRAGLIYEKIAEARPAVIAFQEVVPRSLEVLRRLLTEYEFFGGMRTAQHDGEGLYFALRRDEVSLLGGDVFWLSPTPYLPGSRFESQSIFPRVGVYARVLHRASGEILHIFDLHLDYLTEKAAEDGLACTMQYIAARADCIDIGKVIILGDFNVTPDSAALRPLRDCPWLYEAGAALGGTYHAFGTRKNEAGEREDVKIDHIFLSSALRDRVVAVIPWQDEHAGIYLSDHYPVCLTIQ